MRTCLVAAVAVGLLGVADAPLAGALRTEEQGNPYIKVEMKGKFRREGFGPKYTPAIVVHGDRFRLEIKWPKGVAVDKEMEKLDGKTVIVYGTLSLRRPIEGQHIVYVTRLVTRFVGSEEPND